MSIRLASKLIQYFVIFPILAVTYCNVAGAEPLSLDPDAEPATLIAFKPEPKMGEFVGRAEGMVDNTGKRFFLNNLNVMAPLAIQIFAKDPSKPVSVSLHRFLWREANQQGQTDENGDWTFVGRIHDEVGIELKASEPSEFYVLAWRGPEHPTDFEANLFIPAQSGGNTTTGPDSGSTSVPWLAITIVIAIAVVAIAYMALRFRGSQQNVAVIACLALGASLVATDARADPINANWGSRLAAAEAGLEFMQSSFDERFGVTAEELQHLRDYDNQIQADFNETRSIIAERLHGHDDAIELTNEQIAEMSGIIAERLAGIDGDIATLYMLVEQDRTAIPDPTFGGVEPMPSSCFVGSRVSSELGIGSAVTTDPVSSACAECFDAANQKLVEQLGYYEQLRVIYSNQRTLTDYAVMTGDALSGFHQLEQAAWYSIKLMITKAQAEVTKAYNTKYEEYNGRLDGILREFGQCEAMNGNDGWYERHGKLFYNSLISSYRVYDTADSLL